MGFLCIAPTYFARSCIWCGPHNLGLCSCCLIFLVWCCFCCPSFEDSEPPIRLYHPDLSGSGRNESEQQIQQGGFTIGAKRTASTSTATEANPETSPTFYCSLASWHGPKATVSFEAGSKRTAWEIFCFAIGQLIAMRSFVSWDSLDMCTAVWVGTS